MDALHGMKSPASARSSKSSPNKAKSERSAAGTESKPHAGGAEEGRRRPEDYRSTPNIALKRCAIDSGVLGQILSSKNKHDSRGWVSRLVPYRMRPFEMSARIMPDLMVYHRQEDNAT